ncbi:MAG: Ig-like domain-containing protein [Alistipes sp.]|nr:Ig-like domain-containing protein [Alistipes sp.]
MKRIFTILAMVALLLAGCEKEAPEPAPIAVKVSQIKLVGMPTEFTVGRSVTISAVITPDDAADKSVTFTSSNPEVATVEYTESEYNYSLALLKAVGPGKATITATANDGSGVKDEAEVTVISNTFTSPANCYIVTKADAYTFKAVKGNSSESVGNVASAEVLWESFGTHETPEVGDLVKEVSYNNGEITFKATDRKGNAVIAAKDAAGNILWSWHIWLTDQPKEQEYYHNAVTMMDRNLGATSATPGDVGALGLLYQWGRKDPFLGSSSISSSTVAKSTNYWPPAVSSDSFRGTIAYAIANPTTFITNDTNYDWYYTGNEVSNNTRWTTSESSKSIYDPCPSGWRVPDGSKYGIWSNALGSSSSFTQSSLYDSTNKGVNFSGKFGPDQTIWYPASGSRSLDDGSLGDVGNYGNYWSASPVSPYDYGAYYMYFYHDGYAYPSGGRLPLDRADGLSVRCVKE